MKQIAILASGNGSNAEAIVQYFRTTGEAEVALIITNKPQAGVIQRAERLGIPCHYFTNAELREGTRPIALMRERGVELIVLAGYLCLITPIYIMEYPKRPDFKGRSDKRVGVSVPFYVYMSPSLRAAHPELWQQMQAAKDYPYETDLFTHTLTGLLGIKTKYSQPRYELFSPQYDTKRPRSVFQMGRGMMPLEE